MMKRFINTREKKALPLVLIVLLLMSSTAGCAASSDSLERSGSSEYKGYTIQDSAWSHKRFIWEGTSYDEETTTAVKDQQVVVTSRKVSLTDGTITEMRTEYHKNGKLMTTDSKHYNQNTKEVVKSIIDSLIAASTPTPTVTPTVRPITPDNGDSQHDTGATPEQPTAALPEHVEGGV